MFSSLVKRSRVVGPLVVVAVVTALTVAGVPAVADPVAQTAGVSKKMVKMVKRALGLSRRATKRSNQAIKIARNADGQQGPQGPAGPAGPRGLRGLKGEPGANGSNGTNGTNGAPGADGKTVRNGDGPPPGVLGNDGDFYVDTDANEIYGPKDGTWPATGVPMQGPQGPQGIEGQPWDPDNTLPDGATLTGTWAVGEGSPTAGSGAHMGMISFPIRLAAALGSGQVHYIPTDDVMTPEINEAEVPPECDDGDTDNGAPGVGNPEAEPGNLCVYGAGFGMSSTGDNVQINAVNLSTTQGAASPHGALLTTDAAETGNYFGSYAVTGFDPEE